MFANLISYLAFFSFLLASIYFFIPEIMLHYFGIGSWKRQYSPGVVITFDDGPDPKYTPLLLNILARNKIKACFFLVGEKAEKNPALVKMIQEQGHIIGSHGYVHKHAWLMSPQTTWENWDKGIDVIKKVIGSEPDYIRPPWGSVNLSLYLWSLARNKKIVSWTAKGKDWKEQRSTSDIIKTIITKTAEGTIILLHDSGGEQSAPNNTLACLDELFGRIRKELKLPIVPLEFPNWPLTRRIAFRLWEKWEHLYAKIYRLRRIDDQNLFRLTLTSYRGPNLYNEKGDLLATKGDNIGEIHFDNIRFQTAGSNLQSAGIKALKQVRMSLPVLASYIATHPEFQHVKVYIGTTLLNRGARGLGFNVLNYPYSNGYLIGILQKIIIRIYHPAGKERKTESLGTKPKLVWISKDKLLEKYQKKEKNIS
ncbi:MAG: polysaccharide deacetylase family protein [Desulfitobacteriia bacterium]